MFYSKSTGGFYDPNIHGGAIPTDAVEITNEAHAALLVGQAAGLCIMADAQGAPHLAVPVPPPLAELIAAAVAKVRAARVNVFATLAGIQSQAMANADTATAKDISSLQDQLKALPDVDLSGCKTQADIDGAFLAAWETIAESAPPKVQTAFAQVLA